MCVQIIDLHFYLCMYLNWENCVSFLFLLTVKNSHFLLSLSSIKFVIKSQNFVPKIIKVDQTFYCYFETKWMPLQDQGLY